MTARVTARAGTVRSLSIPAMTVSFRIVPLVIRILRTIVLLVLWDITDMGPSVEVGQGHVYRVLVTLDLFR